MEGIWINAGGMSAKFQSKTGQMQGYVRDQGTKAVEAQMRSIRQVIINTSPVDTGHLKASWSPVRAVGSLAYACGTNVHYAPTLEYGGYPRVGPRTIRLGGGEIGAGFVAGPGIYSQQAPLGFVRKALAGSVRQLRLRIRNVLKQGWGGLGEGDATMDESPTPTPGSPPGRQSVISQTGGIDAQTLHLIFQGWAGGGGRGPSPRR